MARVGKDYDESEHPRDESGRWADSGGGGDAPGREHGEVLADNARAAEGEGNKVAGAAMRLGIAAMAGERVSPKAAARAAEIMDEWGSDAEKDGDAVRARAFYAARDALRGRKAKGVEDEYVGLPPRFRLDAKDKEKAVDDCGPDTGDPRMRRQNQPGEIEHDPTELSRRARYEFPEPRVDAPEDDEEDIVPGVRKEERAGMLDGTRLSYRPVGRPRRKRAVLL